VNEENMNKVLEIPVSWFNFITLMLLTPEKFDWTKNFLNSALWKLLLDNANKEETISFIIPDKCHVTQAPHCKISEIDNSDEGDTTDKGKEERSPPWLLLLLPRGKEEERGLLWSVR
jgi:hypothetical protein